MKTPAKAPQRRSARKSTPLAPLTRTKRTPKPPAKPRQSATSQKAITPRQSRFSRAAAALPALTLATLPACTTITGAILGEDATATANAIDTPATLPLNATTAVYREDDENTLDIYITDLTNAQLTALDPTTPNPATFTGGQLVHIHLFLWPKPGRSPIDFTASNATITHLVIAPTTNDSTTPTPPQITVYSGAGFLLPQGLFNDPGDQWFPATMNDGTLRFLAASTAATPPFNAASYNLDLRARRAPDRVAQLERLLTNLTDTPLANRPRDDR